MRCVIIIFLFIQANVIAESLPIADIDASRKVSYANDIAPLFKKSCIACHNSTKAKGKLNLESVDYMMQGADGFEVLVPGKSNESLVFLLAAHQEEEFMPPPKNKSNAPNLTPEGLGLLKLWIDQGAKDDSSLAKAKKINFTKMSDNVKAIYSVAISQDNQFVAAGRGNSINMYHLPSGKSLGELIDPSIKNIGPSAHVDIVGGMAFSRNGILASGGFRNVKLWKQKPPQEIFKIKLKETMQTALVIDSGLANILSGNVQGEVHLHSLDTKKTSLMTSHNSSVVALSFIGDNKFASIDSKGFLLINEIGGKNPVINTQLSYPVNSLAYIEDKNWLSLGCEDGFIRILSVDNMLEMVGEIKAHSANVNHIRSLARVGAGLISSGTDSMIRFWKIDGAKISKVRELNNESEVRGLSLSKDGNLIASISKGGKIRIWNTADGKLKLESNNKWVIENKVKSDEQKKAVYTRVGEERKKQVVSSEKKIKDDLATLEKAKESESKMKEALEKKKIELADASKLKSMSEADLKSKEEAKDPNLKPFQDKLKKDTDTVAAKEKELEEAERKHVESVRSREIAERFLQRSNEADGKAKEQLARSQQDLTNAIKAHEESLQFLAESKSELQTVIFSEDASRVFAGSNDGNLYSWEVEGAKPSGVTNFGSNAFDLMAIKGDEFVVISKSKWIRSLSDKKTWVLDRVIGGIDDPKTIVDRVNAISFSPDGKFLATGGGVPSRSGELKVWKVSNGELVSSNVESHSDTISGLAFSPSGGHIATAATDRFVKVFNPEGGVLEKSFEGHTNHVLDVSWSADEFLIASAGADHVVKIWDYEKGTQKETVKGHTKAVGSIAYIGVTGTLLSSSGDKSVRLSNKPLPDSNTFIHVSGASADGSHVAAGGEDSILRIWTTADSKLILKLQ